MMMTMIANGPHLRQDSHLSLDEDLFPYAFLQCTCEKYPKVTHVSNKMLDLLGLTPESTEWQAFISENIFFAIPFEERDYFRERLEEALSTNKPVEIDHHLIRDGGDSIPITGWISIASDADGEKNFFVACMPMAKDDIHSTTNRKNSYFQALESAYGLIFEINTLEKTVECIHGRDTSDIGSIADIHMTLCSAMDFWLNNYILDADRSLMEDFFTWITTPGAIESAQRPLQAEFRVKWEDGVVYSFLGVAVQLDTYTVLFCCRDISNVQFLAIEARENQALRRICGDLQSIIKNEKSIRGLISYQAEGDKLLFSYISENVRRKLQLDDRSYLACLTDGMLLDEFLARLNLRIEEHERVLQGGAVMLELPGENDEMLSVCALCSPREKDEITSYDVFIYDNVPAKGGAVSPKGVYARTFGYFDIFVDGQPVIFTSQKEKELLALLIDRNGGTLGASEAIGLLWEGETATERVKARYRKLAMSLKNTLESYGIADILVNTRGTRNIDTSKLKCDYYEYLAGNPEYRSAFSNAYMSGYSWGEYTLGLLWD